MTTKRIDYPEPKPAFLRLHSWAGYSQVHCEVIGETPKRYRIRLLQPTLLPGARRLEAGDVTLVPKDAVKLREEWLQE